MTTPSELAKKLHHQTVLVELSQLRPSSIDDALRSILTAAARTLEVERASFWTLSSDGSAIRCIQLYVASSQSFSQGAILERRSYPAYFDALLTCQSISAHDAVVDPRTSEFAVGYFDLYGIRAMLDVPVWTDGKLVGVVCLEHLAVPRRWAVEEEDFVRSVANIVAMNLVAAERSRAEERYRLVSRASGDIVWEWDLGDDHIEWGDRLTEALGHPITAEGTGLGLSISHSLVRALGGDIRVESQMGAGAKFRVTLPATAIVRKAEGGVATTVATKSWRPRVLVVDDEAGVRTVVKRLLSRDFDVELSDSGRAALAILAKSRFDVVLCDVMMPDVSGIDVYDGLRARDPALARRMVFMTGNAFAPEARALAEHATLPALPKPLDVNELRRVVAQVAGNQGSATA